MGKMEAFFEKRFDDSQLLTQPEVEKILRVSHTKFQQFKNSGKFIPAIKIGRRYFYNPVKLREWLDAGGEMNTNIQGGTGT